jgi:uncharacterized membrane protein YgdD (TMEM256/DUF423 family)
VNAPDSLFLRLAASFGATGVALGAFGAHGLKKALADNPRGPDLLAAFETGCRYQMLHALALFGVAFLVAACPGRAARTAGWLFTAGIVLFSGSLYLLGGLGWKWLGPVTPLGGLSFIAGWIALLVAAGRRG